jgi:hypothetical protein
MKSGEGILKKYPTFPGEAFCSAWSSKAKGTLWKGPQEPPEQMGADVNYPTLTASQYRAGLRPPARWRER